MLRVYVSSTVLDLQAERAAVIKWLSDAQYMPIHSYSADPRELSESCRGDVAGVDIFLLIIGDRCGEIPLMNNPDGMSITWMEYVEAKRNGKPCFVFKRMSTPNKALSDLSSPAKRDCLDRFLEAITERPFEFLDNQGLVSGLSVALSRYSASVGEGIDGVVRGLLKKIAEDSIVARNLKGTLVFNPPNDVQAVLPRGEFIGRTNVLKELSERLGESKGCFGIYGFSGMGGVGKSELARELVYLLSRDKVFCDGILWLRVNRDSYAETLITVWVRLGGTAPVNPDLVAMRQEIRRVLAGRRMLVVLDNCDEPDRVPPLLELFSEQAVLVTTRRPESHRVEWHAIDIMSPEEGRSLLRQLCPSLRLVPNHELDAVAVERLNGLPLAISLAGRWLRETKRSLADYCKRFDRYLLDAVKRDAGGDEVRLTDVRACFDVSWELLTPVQRQMFVLASLFGGDSFPERLLINLIQLSKENVKEGDVELWHADADAQQKEIDVLVASNILMRPNPDRLAVHSLLRDYGREQKLTMDVLSNVDVTILATLLKGAIRDAGADFVVAEFRLIEEVLLTWQLNTELTIIVE